MDASKIRQEISQLQSKLSRIEKQLLNERGPFIPGAIIERYGRCGKPTCRCHQGKLHGPYSALSRPVEGRSEVIHLTAETRSEIEGSVRRYQSYQRCLTEWRKTIRELEGLFTKLRESQVKELPRSVSKRKKKRKTRRK